MKHLALSLVLGLSAGAVQAQPVITERMGDWASGGGELIQDGHNPWFIQSTKVVKYCTVFDSSTYHQTRIKSDLQVRRALAFWHREFEIGQNMFTPRVEVGTQVFLSVPCPNRLADVDVVFQFGFLDPEQLEYVKEPSRYAALTVRTEYDPVILKGKGFVYIGADTGPQSFVGPHTVDSPWTVNDGGLLYWTLVHELGHMFGMPHTTQRPDYPNVMAAAFVETIMTPSNASIFTTDLSANPIFDVFPRHGSQGVTMECRQGPHDNQQPLRKFFGIDPTWPCWGTRIVPNGVEIYAQPAASQGSRHDSEILIGTATIEERISMKRDQSFTLVHDAMAFWLPKEQTVLPANAHHIFAPAYQITDAVANYRSKDGLITRQMSLSADPTRDDPLGDDFRFGGMVDGKLYVNLREGI